MDLEILEASENVQEKEGEPVMCLFGTIHKMTHKASQASLKTVLPSHTVSSSGKMGPDAVIAEDVVY